MTTTKINRAVSEAAKTDKVAKAAADHLAAVEADAHAAGTAGRITYWQERFNTYDPEADQANVVEAGRALESALANSEFGKALTGYLVAVLEAKANHDSALSALANGATGELKHEFQSRDAAGQNISNNQVESWFQGTELTPPLFLRMIWESVTTKLAHQAEELACGADTAYERAGASGPVGYRVAATRGASGRHQVGATWIDFHNNTAWMPADHPAVGYFQRKAEFEVTPVFDLPEGTAIVPIETQVQAADTVVKRPATAEDAYKRRVN